MPDTEAPGITEVETKETLLLELEMASTQAQVLLVERKLQVLKDNE